MRFYIAIACAALLLGCNSPGAARISSALQTRVSDVEARHILLDHIDRAINVARAANNEDSRLELEVLSKKRQQLASKFDSFWSGSRNGDELWTYRTYVTPDQRGGESGFALVRHGRVVEQMSILTYD